MNRVAIVVLNWNGLTDTKECLRAISKQSYMNYHIILIDNGSVEKNTSTFLNNVKEDYGDKVSIVRNKINYGFAGGVNIGIQRAIDGDFNYVALLNNDAFVDENWLYELVQAAVSQKSAITTGLLLHEDGKTIDSSGDWYSVWGLPFPRSRNTPTNDAPLSGSVFGASGGASLYRISLFSNIGLFDEKFFAYYEDVDISFRAQLAGKSVYYTRKAIAYHKRGATSSTISGFAVEQTMKNLPMLFVKNVPSGLFLTVGMKFFVAYYLIFIKALLGPNRFSALRGYVFSIIYTPRSIIKRFNIQHTKSTSSGHIKSIIWNDLPPDQIGLRRFFRK